jgi:hypothetical protein
MAIDYTKDDVEVQWEKWSAANPVEDMDDPDFEQIKQETITDLEFVSKMDVKEYTLYQKWCEVQEKYPFTTVNDLWEGEKKVLANDKQRIAIEEVKNNVWNPQDIDEFMKIEPELIYANKQEDLPELWNVIRTFSSTMKNNANIGRNLNFIVRDKPTKKYLGVICISSDFLDLTPRDNFIGWSRELKTQGSMINHTAIGSTIVPLQPLGYNYTGGKLLALLCLDDKIQKLWKELYGDTLIGVTTTSLYGKAKLHGLSQYDRLTHWKKMGFTAGSVKFEPRRVTRNKINDWIKKNHTRKYFEWYVAKKPSGQPHKRDHKNRSLSFAYSQMKMDKALTQSAHARGIYFSPLYNNSAEFLRGDITEDKLVKSFDTSTEALVTLWKEKYATKRIRNLKESNRVSTETLFYDNLTVLSWEETKDYYLDQVGR